MLFVFSRTKYIQPIFSITSREIILIIRTFLLSLFCITFASITMFGLETYLYYDFFFLQTTNVRCYIFINVIPSNINIQNYQSGSAKFDLCYDVLDFRKKITILEIHIYYINSLGIFCCASNMPLLHVFNSHL